VEFMPRMEGTILHAIIAPSKKAEQPKAKPAAAPAGPQPAQAARPQQPMGGQGAPMQNRS